VHINGSLWGVYSLVQQENGQLISDWFPGNNGDRWRTPNAPQSNANSAFGYRGPTNIATYQAYYDLRTTTSPASNAWQRLVNTIYILNTTPTNLLRDSVEEVLAVDDWRCVLSIEK